MNNNNQLINEEYIKQIQKEHNISDYKAASSVARAFIIKERELESLKKERSESALQTLIYHEADEIFVKDLREGNAILESINMQTTARIEEIYEEREKLAEKKERIAQEKLEVAKAIKSTENIEVMIKEWYQRDVESKEKTIQSFNEILETSRKDLETMRKNDEVIAARIAAVNKQIEENRKLAEERYAREAQESSSEESDEDSSPTLYERKLELKKRAAELDARERALELAEQKQAINIKKETSLVNTRNSLIIDTDKNISHDNNTPPNYNQKDNNIILTTHTSNKTNKTDTLPIDINSLNYVSLKAAGITALAYASIAVTYYFYFKGTKSLGEGAISALSLSSKLRQDIICCGSISACVGVLVAAVQMAVLSCKSISRNL